MNPRIDTLALAFLGKEYARVGEFYDADCFFKSCVPIPGYNPLFNIYYN
jgi:hypothetical protein